MKPAFRGGGVKHSGFRKAEPPLLELASVFAFASSLSQCFPEVALSKIEELAE